MLRRDVVGSKRYVMQNLDFIFFRKIAKDTKVFFIAEQMGVYYTDHGGGSLSKQRKKFNMDKSIKRAKCLDDFLQEFGYDLLAYCPRRYAAYAYGAAVGLFFFGDVTKARFYIKKALNIHKKPRYIFLYLLCIIPGLRHLVIRVLK